MGLPHRHKKRLPIFFRNGLSALFFIGATALAQESFVPNGPTYVPTGVTPPAGTIGQSALPTGSQIGGPSPLAPNATVNPATNTSTNTDTNAQAALGLFRNSNGTVKIGPMLLSRYKNSVVRIRALDSDGNELGRAMGTSVGRPPNQFIATPLSLLLGNSQQWADKIEISHVQGNHYSAKIALVDEERNIALLRPEVYPAPINFVPAEDERPQIEVFTISFSDGRGGATETEIHKSALSAVNTNLGLLSMETRQSDDQQAGTAVLNPQGELVGMLLPNGRGVLSSAIQRLIRNAQDMPPIEPHLLGVIMGRGVAVDPNSSGKQQGVYKTIRAALAAIRNGEAPKADPGRFLPATSQELKPKGSDKVVVRLLPGNYQEEKPLILFSNLSLAGSGPKSSVLSGTDSSQPVLALVNAKNVLISGMRISPPKQANEKIATILIDKSSDVALLGNILQAKGGAAVAVRGSQNINLNANTFVPSRSRAVLCQDSSLAVEANAFLGPWDIALSADRLCQLTVKRNLFLQNHISVADSSLAQNVMVENNSFIRSDAGIKVTGVTSNIRVNDNIFYENRYGVFGTLNLPAQIFGRNSSWKSRFIAHGKLLKDLDLIRTEPSFENPNRYDFRIRPGGGEVGVAENMGGGDIGAYQRSDYLGRFTSQFIHTLEAATNEKGLGESWGYQE